MKSFRQFITEGRDAPLYHGCTAYNAKYNFEHNGLFPSTESRGISLSRNKHFSMSWGPIVFELDQRKLSHNYKFEPFNFFGHPSVNFDKNYRTGRPSGKGLLRRKSHFLDQQEERIMRDIKPLDKYLTGIWMDQAMLDRAVTHGTEDELVQKILANPHYKGTFNYNMFKYD